MKKLTIYLDKHYDFELAIYKQNNRNELLCLIERPDNFFMLLRQSDNLTSWDRIKGSDFHPGFQQAIIKLAPLLMPCMLLEVTAQPAATINPDYLK